MNSTTLVNAWYLLPLNAEPWKSPSPSIGRRNRKLHVEIHKDQGLSAYQAAVKEQMATLYPNAPMIEGEVDVTFYYWRNLAVYKGAKKTVHRQACDATNMQKALEDALQGILYVNDKDNVHVESYVMEQGSRVEPLTLIRIRHCDVRPNLAVKVAELKADWPTLVSAGNVRDIEIEEVF